MRHASLTRLHDVRQRQVCPQSASAVRSAVLASVLGTLVGLWYSADVWVEHGLEDAWSLADPTLLLHRLVRMVGYVGGAASMAAVVAALGVTLVVSRGVCGPSILRGRGARWLDVVGAVWTIMMAGLGSAALGYWAVPQLVSLALVRDAHESVNAATTMLVAALKLVVVASAVFAILTGVVSRLFFRLRFGSGEHTSTE